MVNDFRTIKKTILCRPAGEWFKKVIVTISSILVLLSFIVGCGRDRADIDKKSEKIIVSVSILPQKFFVEKIGGDKVSINTLIPNGASPVLYEPNPLQMKNLEKSTVYFKVGHPNFAFEKRYFNEISNLDNNLQIVDMFSGVSYREFKNEHHHHSDEESHDENIMDKEIHTDSHVWTSPENVKIAALNIFNILSKIDSKNTKFYKNNYDIFIEEIGLLQLRITNIFADTKTEKFLVFHPSWGYFADEFNLEQISVEVDGKQPSMKLLLSVIEEARENEIKVVFVQEGFSKSSAKVIAKELDASIITISPLTENWLENLYSVANKIGKRQ